MLDGVDTAVGCADHLIEDGEGCLEGGELDECAHRLDVRVSTALDLLSATGQTGEVEVWSQLPSIFIASPTSFCRL